MWTLGFTDNPSPPFGFSPSKCLFFFFYYFIFFTSLDLKKIILLNFFVVNFWIFLGMGVINQGGGAFILHPPPPQYLALTPDGFIG